MISTLYGAYEPETLRAHPPVPALDRLRLGSLFPRGEKMLYSGADPESYITEYTLVYEDNLVLLVLYCSRA